ncbi:adenylosuccinate lyase [Candidatus Woesebacteria bacterium RIFCSPHIGHO2_12_FULL_42_9]|uniref:Adenylosuccinate lyase n=3 Tax=Candidatus Woeseibacteriota TaxID=1752722 RepID=A0A1F8AWY1_9BACT|nr:MAG: Adenylosuccinate lyase [Candidatus Woesebacteria bacterium GW2011_GWB1_43_14]OGM04943.1 MAG: adenylosuccinate lyase [Candidatus Woesebacteria bacterium GWA1_42_12]OGM55768.1 MAG: adenylosuccinate lyase [Candidatus Woesebacteria bacterium RIFCSPHIGHO2_12_FULL_42_9]
MGEIKFPKPFTHLTAISSLDGRFRGRVEDLSKYFSEYATIRGRVYVEIEYLLALLKVLGKPVSLTDQKKLRNIAESFNLHDAQVVTKKDEEINHDTKAVEYFLGEKLRKLGLIKLINSLHLGLTSTDIDSTGQALSIKDFLTESYLPRAVELIQAIKKLAKEHKSLVMLARTHGQIAVPTTAGKELNYFALRLHTQLKKLKLIKIGSKITGAVGNHNALTAAFPTKDWLSFSKNFLKKLGLESYPLTTQVEPYEHKVELFQAVKRVNLIILAMDEDIWRYLALGYLSLRDAKGHVGSSTMPQKINPIGFEMSENYASLANGIFDVLEKRLPLNRWQRDLTDKYLLRDLGQAFVMSVLSYESAIEALTQIGFNKGVIEKDLDNHWEAIAEGIQTILRTTSYTQPYEKLKELTRGKIVTKESYEKFIDEIEVPEDIKKKLRLLSPKTYIGIANKLARI